MLSAIVSLIGWLLKIALKILEVGYSLVVVFSLMMSKPIRKLLDKIKAYVGEKLPIPDGLNRFFHPFNGLMPFLLFLAALIFAGVSFWISSRNWDPNDNYLVNMLYNTTLGSFLGFLSGGLEFTPATVVAIAFSGAMLPLCMDTHNRGEEKAPVYIRMPCYAVYLIACSILATMLTGVFQSVGQWGYQTILELFNLKGASFLVIAGKILAMIPLCYIALLLCLITVRTYVECFVFGLAGTIGMLVIILLLQLIPEQYNTIKEIVTMVVVVVMFFGLDILQSRTMDQLYKEVDEAGEEPSAV